MALVCCWLWDHLRLDALDCAAANTQFGGDFENPFIAERQRLPNRRLFLALELWATERLSGFSSFFASPPNTDAQFCGRLSCPFANQCHLARSRFRGTGQPLRDFGHRQGGRARPAASLSSMPRQTTLTAMPVARIKSPPPPASNPGIVTQIGPLSTDIVPDLFIIPPFLVYIAISSNP
jgi:hypothetical protein